MGRVACATRVGSAAVHVGAPAFSPGVVLGSSMGRVTGGRRSDEPTVRRTTTPGLARVARVKRSPYSVQCCCQHNGARQGRYAAPAGPEPGHLRAPQAARQTWRRYGERQAGSIRCLRRALCSEQHWRRYGGDEGPRRSYSRRGARAARGWAPPRLPGRWRRRCGGRGRTGVDDGFVTGSRSDASNPAAFAGAHRRAQGRLGECHRRACTRPPRSCSGASTWARPTAS